MEPLDSARQGDEARPLAVSAEQLRCLGYRAVDLDGFQQTRGFRALKLWVTLQHLGRNGVAAHVARHNALARRLAMLVDAAPELELLAPVTLSIVCFRYVPPAWPRDDPRLDALNKAIMQEVQAGGEAFVTNAVLRGRFALRACILHYGTSEADLTALLNIVCRTGARLAAEPPAG